MLTVASALAYLQLKDAQKAAGPGWKLTLVKHGTAQVYVLCSTRRTTTRMRSPQPPVAIVTFRGTELPDENSIWEVVPDWIRNLRFRLVQKHDVEEPVIGRRVQYAHGYSDTWDELRDPIVEKLSDLAKIYGDLDVVVTGHSQGGALASISLLDLSEKGLPFHLKGAITVAQPKCGNVDHRNKVNSRAYKLQIPVEILANSSDVGVDPVVCAPSPLSELPLLAFYDLLNVHLQRAVTPPGHFWLLKDGVPPRRLTPTEHDAVVQASTPTFLWRLLSATLHWPGGRTGYLQALDATPSRRSYSTPKQKSNGIALSCSSRSPSSCLLFFIFFSLLLHTVIIHLSLVASSCPFLSLLHREKHL